MIQDRFKKLQIFLERTVTEKKRKKKVNSLTRIIFLERNVSDERTGLLLDDDSRRHTWEIITLQENSQQ